MTPKMACFLLSHELPTPCFVLDVDRVAERYAEFQAAFPGVATFYAVKANPAPEILRRLVALGASFDAASLAEVSACLAAGAPPSAISFGNTVKKEVAISAAFAVGVRLFAFDSVQELEKLARAAPGSKVYCRILVGNDGAEWPLSRKFGCELPMAVDLMQRAAASGLDPYGLSFHVGSQQMKTHAYAAAVGRAASVIHELAANGVHIRVLNIGGGFPIRYQDDIPQTAAFGDALTTAMVGCGISGLAVMAEPGRYLVADAGALLTEVVLVSRKSEGDEVRWVYVDIGRFGGLAETEGEAIRYDVRRTESRGETALAPTILAGPTCDSTDTLYQANMVSLPVDLSPGDRLVIRGCGAYVTTYASQGFNGFAPPTELYI